MPCVANKCHPTSNKTNMSDNLPQTEILIIDDDIILQELLHRFLCGQGFRVICAETGEKAAKTLTLCRPSLIVLDIIMPGKDGFYWLQWIKQNHPDTPVLVLSSQSSDQDRIQGLELGAEDYLTKPFHPKELLIRVRNILRFRPLPDKKIFMIGSCLFDPERELLIHWDIPTRLTPEETRLLLFFCQNPGEILTRDAISHALHGNEHHPLDRSIDMRVYRLKKKLNGTLDMSKHLQTVWRKGYRFIL